MNGIICHHKEHRLNFVQGKWQLLSQKYKATIAIFKKGNCIIVVMELKLLNTSIKIFQVSKKWLITEEIDCVDELHLVVTYT